MRFWRYSVIPVILLFVLLLTRCFSTGPSSNDHARSSIGGTGSEVVGVVNYPDSTSSLQKSTLGPIRPMSVAGVYIHPKTYLPDINQGTDIPYGYTEQDGSFVIRNVVPGEHLVYVNDGKGMAIARRISVAPNSPRIELGTLVSQKTASVQVQYQGSMPGNVLFYVALAGTGLNIKCTDRNLHIALSNIPTGPDLNYSVNIRMYKPLSGKLNIDIPDLVPDQLFTLKPFTDLDF